MHLVKHIVMKHRGSYTVAGQTVLQKKNRKHALVQNIHFQEAMVRFGFTLLIPMVMLGIDKHLIIYTSPLIAYLFYNGAGPFLHYKVCVAPLYKT